jgi:hypothetical protein
MSESESFPFPLFGKDSIRATANPAKHRFQFFWFGMFYFSCNCLVHINEKEFTDMKHWGANIYLLILIGMAVLLILLGLFRIWFY